MEKAAPSAQATFHDGVGRIVFSNPARRNAMTRTMWHQLTDAARAFARKTDLRAVILRGEGDVAFVSGADISEFGDSRRDPSQASAYSDTIQEAIEAIEAIPAPVIALVHGFCIGAGTAIALACDLRYFSDDATFAIPAGRLAVGYDPRWIKRLVDVVGPAGASNILLTARHFDAAAALRLGFATEVRPKADLDAFVEEIARGIVENAPLTMEAAKRAIQQSAAFDRDRDWQTPFALADRCARSQDYLRALDAFAQKKRPVFQGN